MISDQRRFQQAIRKFDSENGKDPNKESFIFGRMEIFMHPESWIALLTLTFLEIVLGVDNIIFISIVSNKLPEAQRGQARTTGLAMALVFRVAMLLGITWIITFTQPLLTIYGIELSGRDLILLAGGLFLLFKSTMEIHHKMEGVAQEHTESDQSSMLGVISQIVLLDIIFSFDVQQTP